MDDTDNPNLHIANPHMNRPIRSFSLRSSRMTRAQKKGFDHAHLYMLDTSNPIVIDSQFIFGNKNPLIIELGFGMGESLLTMCKQFPHHNFIGIEVHRPGIGYLLHHCHLLQLTNLKIICADGVDILKNMISNNSIYRVQLYFPDPWHKKRHHKRRLINSLFLQLCIEKLVPEGMIHIATDWQPYVEEMCLSIQILLQQFESTQPGLLWYETLESRPLWRPITKYEQRGLRLKHQIIDIIIHKQKNKFQ